MRPNKETTVLDILGDLATRAADNSCPTLAIIGASDIQCDEIVEAIRDSSTECAVIVLDSRGHLQNLKPEHPVMELKCSPMETMEDKEILIKPKGPKYRCDGKQKRR